MIKKRSKKTEKEREIRMIEKALQGIKKKVEVAKKRNKPEDVEYYSKVVEALEELLELNL